MSVYPIALIPGDTVGPELAEQAEKVFRTLSAESRHDFPLIFPTACGSGIESFGLPMPSDSLRQALQCRAVLLGNIGSARYHSLPPSHRPEQALLLLRDAFQVRTNLRPLRVISSLSRLSPLKEAYVKHGIDIVVVRDLQGGMLSRRHKKKYGKNGRDASDVEYYNVDMIRFTAEIAFKLAAARKKHVVSLDKSNVLASGLLWRQTVSQYGKLFPEIALSHQFIDNAAMDVIRRPGDFDVIVTSNVFGDILSDELAQITGTPCLFGSAELAADGRGLYTPNQLHCSDESMTGKNQIHPFGILDAVVMILRYSCGRTEMADLLREAMKSIINDRLTTPELPAPGFSSISTCEMGDEIVKRLKRLISLSMM